MFTDSNRVTLVNGVVYEVVGKVRKQSTHKRADWFQEGNLNELFFVKQYVTRKVGDIQLAGANPSAEEMEEESEVATESGVDIVLNNRLQEVPFLQDKKAFQGYLKDYMKA